jgi:hypothetical protein
MDGEYGLIFVDVIDIRIQTIQAQAVEVDQVPSLNLQSKDAGLQYGRMKLQLM